MIAIHSVHRKLAEVVLMNTDVNGNLLIEQGDLKLILGLLRQNYELVYQLDSLKELSLVAYEAGDMDWFSDLTKRIDDIEAKCI